MTRSTLLASGAALALVVIAAVPTSSFLVGNWWNDSTNIVMDDVFLPQATWSNPAQNQLAEWNQVDVTTNNHPFLIGGSPQFSFGADDGDNTMGFLGEAGLNSEYGLSYSSALAWTVCWSSGRISECDMMLDPTLPWSLGPDDDEWFQSTVLHEAGHIRGLDHYNNFLSMQNSGVNKKLRAETLYMDDKEAVRQHATSVNEFDMAIYPKWHNGSTPQWMSSPSATTLRSGSTIQWDNITVENRGTNAFGALSVGFYMSDNTTISTGDTFLNSGSWGSFGRFTFSTFDWSATVPTVSDCTVRYFGGIIDNTNAWSERFEGNNATAFNDGGPDPQAYTILLARDFLEPNDSFAGARLVTMPLNSASLSIDQDNENDYYRFTLTKASRIDATVTFTNASGNINLQLLNSGGSIVASSAGVGNSETISSNVAAGTYYLRVYGSGSGSCNRYSIAASATPTPVSVSAIDFEATELGPTTGTFRVTRVGSTTLPLSVFYSVGGTATAGVDYVSLGSSVIIPAGALTADVTVTPIADALVEPAESVVLTLSNNAAYTVTAPGASTVRITDGADLVISAFTAPAVGGKGAPISLSVVTRNSGTGSAAASTSRVYLSANTVVDAGDVLLASIPVPALAGGGTFSAAAVGTIPAAIADGGYYLIAAADAAGAVAETNEANNLLINKIRIGPDLVIRSITPPASASAGSVISIPETTVNLGGSSPAGASVTTLYLSADAVFDPTDVALSSRKVPALAAGAGNSFVHTVTIPRMRPSEQYIIAVADSSAMVVETNEKNNTLARVIAIVP